VGELRFDPDVAALIAARRAARPVSMHEMGIEGVREMMENALRQPGPEMHAVESRVLAGPYGDLEVRIYTPTPEPIAALAYFHGGGMVMGTLSSYDPFSRHLAKATGATVVSVGYRLAPEYTYPTATEEAYFATEWVAAHASELGTSPDLVGVAGDSAGGSLAAAVCLMARDRGGPEILLQLLMYPGVDRDLTLPSITTYENGPLLTKGDIIWMKAAYLGTGPEPDHPYGVPANAEDLSGLPQAILVTAEHDPIRDGCENYGMRLRDAGVQIALLRYPGVCHGFMSQIDQVARTRLALAEIAGLVKAKVLAGVAARDAHVAGAAGSR
jgi:acetyl esterase